MGTQNWDYTRAALEGSFFYKLLPSPKTSPRAKIMTRGELVFCLRDVHSYWSTPGISYYEMEHLERSGLVQRSITGIYSIRLTAEGVRMKNWGPLQTP